MRWKRKYLNEWHEKFAWLPVKIEDEVVWLEKVERKGRFNFGGGYWAFSYRTPNQKAGE